MLVQFISPLYAIYCQAIGEGQKRWNHSHQWRRCFPILAAYVGDYPKQILISLIKKGECPICPAPCDEIRNWESVLELWDTDKVIAALNSINKGASEFMKACASAGIKPVQCVFWKNLPFIDIYCSITPDILHQLY